MAGGGVNQRRDERRIIRRGSREVANVETEGQMTRPTRTKIATNADDDDRLRWMAMNEVVTL